MMKKIAVLLVLVLWPFSAFALQKAEGPKETLWSRVTLHVAWNKRNENSGEVTQGVLHLTMTGTLKLNREYSGIRNTGRFTPLLAYTLQNATYNYMYKDDYGIYRSDNPPKCPNPQRKFDKQGSISGDSGGAPVNLLIHYHAGMAENVARLPLPPPPETKDMLIDYYEFFIRVPAQKVEGKSKEFDADARRCKERDQSRSIFNGDIRIFYRIGQDGKLSGSKSWTSEADPSTFSVEVSDLPPAFKKKPARPEPRGKNDVQYSLTWDLDSPPVAQIEHETRGYWFDITGVDQNVVVGQKIRLKGSVAPSSLDTDSGTWAIGNERTVRPIKKFEASSASGQVIRLDPEGDMKKKEVTFFFTREGESEVTYKTKAGGQDVTAKVKFKIKKPAFILEVIAAQSNTYGPLKVGASNKGFDCCVAPVSPEAQAEINKCDELRKEIAAAKDDAERSMLQREYNMKCRVYGLQYDGITFQAVPQDDTAGEVQYIQIIRAVNKRSGSGEGGSSQMAVYDSLDGCYPYPLNLPPYGTNDAPGFSSPTTLLGYSFTIYLMFRPEGEGNEWVPLKVCYWDWQGAITCDASGCRENKAGALFSSPGNGADADEYPHWTTCYKMGR